MPIEGHEDLAAVNTNAITHIVRTGLNGELYTCIMYNGDQYNLTAEQMAKLEQTIKRRAEDSKIIRRESMKEQMLAQYEISLEIQNGVQRAAGIVGIGGGSNRRH
jgi:hypothetical protein